MLYFLIIYFVTETWEASKICSRDSERGLRAGTLREENGGAIKGPER